MRALAIGLGIALLAGTAVAQSDHYVRGYTRSDGTYVAPHYQTNPNGTTADNWSTRGNVNPYTGQTGTRSPTPSPSYAPPPSYGYPQQRPAPSYGSSYNQGRSANSSFGQPEPDPNQNPF